MKQEQPTNGEFSHTKTSVLRLDVSMSDLQYTRVVPRQLPTYSNTFVGDKVRLKVDTMKKFTVLLSLLALQIWPVFYFGFLQFSK